MPVLDDLPRAEVKEMMRVYVAGPMRGYPAFNFPAFFEAAERLTALGWDVTNPAAMDMECDGFDPTKDAARDEPFYMRRDLPAVLGCDAIALLPGWQHSSGATKELVVALWGGLQVLDALTGEPLTSEGARA